MIDAVTTAIDGDRKRRETESAAREVCKRYACLSRREQQVMNLISIGKMNKQVAFQLGLSIVTVKVYRGAVMHKMAAQTFADLVRMADIVNNRDPASVSPALQEQISGKQPNRSRLILLHLPKSDR